MKTRLLLLLLAGGPVACLAVDSVRPGDPPAAWVDPADPSVAAIRQAGDRLIDRVGNLLVYEVQRAVADAGAAKAVEIVHLKDLALPKLVPGQPRVTAIRHTSLSLRNPANQPDAADRAALDRINTALQNGDDVPMVLVQRIEPANAPVEWRVYRPITTMPLCIKSHGPADSLQPEVRAALARLYPEDQAVGYTAYKWRGVIRISLAAPEPAAGAKAGAP